jgi:hypothetical protein
MSKSHAQPVIDIVADSLEAVRDAEPGKNKHHKLTVVVDVEAEVDWKIKLVEAHPQGTNPQVKLLRFEVVLPTGPHSNAIAQRTLRYTEAPPKAAYTDVTIEDGKQSVSKKVSLIV